MKLLKLLFFLLFVVSVQAQKLSDLYKKVNSSVVVIEIISVGTESNGSNRQLVKESSQGSGVLISEDGKIWTAAHVVQSAEVVSVEFVDGDIYEATIVSSNPQADVALLQIKNNFQLKNKKVATIGDSDKTLIGEDVFVLGAPHGFKQSLSRGIISGRYVPDHRSNDFVKIEFLQTDAAINPGNSGGPMFNMKGEVIGIASRIYSASGGFSGIGFAVSSNIAQKLLSEEENIWTGMEGLLITGNVAKALNVPQESGLLVLSTATQGAASKLGLQGGYVPAVIDGVELLLGGDVILQIAGIPFTDDNSGYLIKKKLKEFKKGEKISISILRHGKIGTAEFYKQ
ncbi:S1C family serine protease [Aquimarina hainanensis]|uniref:S1C family serine protease n=1 Tax=Aquimarina hainanensis TaxID=1578017 RepID=A0ABW5N5M2_9FLAO|nr:trypsin-like peptidase domain-containing protein [Aquimarina sp. TRL1]QKX03979.1 trypsin-like serine protease [Aquimarina sp. TRL1]